VASQLLYVGILWGLTADILIVRFPASIFVKLVLWALSVEILCRILPYLPFPSGPGFLLFYCRLAVLAVATLALYLTADEIRSLWGLLRDDWKQA
jgi:hypothetical protein